MWDEQYDKICEAISLLSGNTAFLFSKATSKLKASGIPLEQQKALLFFGPHDEKHHCLHSIILKLFASH